MRSLAVVLYALIFASGCASDQGITSICSRSEDGFDIQEASILEDAQSYPFMHDAVVLDFDVNDLPEDATWRIKTVEVMPAIPDDVFDSWNGGDTLTVEVFDGDNPYADGWSVTQRLDKSALEWSDVRLDSATSTLYPDNQIAWWPFDFSQTIPQSGMTCTNCLVGVAWGASATPPMGYSNYNRPCAKNWTDYADGFGWIANEDLDAGGSCSWPMLRVTLEVLQERPNCDENTLAVE